jgi:hypothetical protein
MVFMRLLRGENSGEKGFDFFGGCSCGWVRHLQVRQELKVTGMPR